MDLFVCTECGKKFISLDQFVNHVCIVEDKEVFEDENFVLSKIL